LSAVARFFHHFFAPGIHVAPVEAGQLKLPAVMRTAGRVLPSAGNFTLNRGRGQQLVRIKGESNALAFSDIGS
jgi:hypothetical protein